MTPKTVSAVEAECRELLRRIKALQEAKGVPHYYYEAPKLTAAVRRQSMELTRALAEMRKP